jgi:hypothetical protein
VCTGKEILAPKVFRELGLDVIKRGLNCGLFLKEESKEVPAVEEARDVQWRYYSERNQ